MTERTRTRTTRRLMATVTAVCLVLTCASTSFAQDVDDKDVTSAVNTELWIDSATSANSIDVVTQDGVVTLTGTVNNILAKDRAEAIAEATVGVEAVINRIKVEPTATRTDQELAQAIQDAWLADPATDSYEAKAEVDDGVVTLTGEVESYAEKELCATVAKGVAGVKAIRNDIDIEYQTERSDTEIENEIQARLANDVRVDDFLIDVEVDDGDVVLSGTVGSLQEKTTATTDGWVAGVMSVDNDDLEIEWWARDDMRRASTYLARTDAEIKQAVEKALEYDPRVWSFTPEVDVSSGTVTLSGTVDNLAAKRAAEQDARNTLGVWRVKNHLKIRTEIPEDQQLEQRVATALLNDPYVERYDTEIEAYNGWVYLSGDVNTSFEKNRAERAAERVKGVVGVVNNIEYERLWVWKPDWEIRADVKDQLEWSPFVSEADISVSVDEGIVTLTGTVNSWSEFDEAEKNAYQAGAKDVENNLVVQYQYYGPYGPGYYGGPMYHGADYYGPYYEPYY